MAYFWQSPVWDALRSGAWLTPARIRGYSLILLGISAISLVGWIALSDGLSDRNGKPIGTDFSSFYAAGSLVLDGRAGDVYNMAAHYAREQQIFGPATPYYGWLYPPIFLLLAAPLAAMPYPVALAVWQISSFTFYLAVIGVIVGRMGKRGMAIGPTWLAVAAGFPAVLINFGHGQNGFLTAGLLGAALLALPSRQLLAGVLFGLLAYKPQFALVIPIALLAAGQWRAILAAGITVIALVGLTSLIFGFDLWLAFAASTETSRKLLLEQGDVGFEKLQSAFAAVRMWGGGVSLAYRGPGHRITRGRVRHRMDMVVRLATATSNRHSSSSQRCWLRRMFSITTSWCSRSRLHFLFVTEWTEVFAASRSVCWPQRGSFRC